MGFAGTDMMHHLDFLKSAEDYRRYFIKELNDQHAYGGSKTGDWKWTVDSLYFRSVKKYDYKSAKIFDKINYYSLDIICLLLWFVAVNSLIFYKSEKKYFMIRFLKIMLSEFDHFKRSPFKIFSLLLYTMAIIYGCQNGYTLYKNII